MQVAQRSLVPVHVVIGEWSDRVEAVASILDDIESTGLPDPVGSALGLLPLRMIPYMAVNDLIHHEFDLRNAYGDLGGRDLPDIHASAAGHVRSLRTLFGMRDLPTIRIESTDADDGWSIGRDDPVATLRATSFDLMRSIGGRRTREEIAALDWSGDSAPFLDAMVLPHMRMRESPLGE